jgi:hypothetical protein
LRRRRFAVDIPAAGFDERWLSPTGVPMTNKRGNPNWDDPAAMLPPVARPTMFEEFVETLGLLPDQFERSERLREWAKRHKDHKYVRSDLLKAWGFHMDIFH